MKYLTIAEFGAGLHPAKRGCTVTTSPYNISYYMRTHRLSCVAAAVAICGLSSVQHSSAQILFQDNFDSGQSGFSWNTNLSATDAFVDFAYDYSVLGIPSAPNSGG